MTRDKQLYRQWGYTALSRHRHEARFYVAGRDLLPDREKPPPHDQLIEDLTRLLERSQAKELALESLPMAEREQLEEERLALREQLAAHQPRVRRTAHLEDRDVSAAADGRERPREQADQPREWLAEHGLDALRLLAVDQELRGRDAARHRAEHRISRLDVHPLEAPRLDLDTFDLDR